MAGTQPVVGSPAGAEVDALDAAALRRLWPDVLEIVKQTSRRTRALLDNAQVTATDGQLVTVSAPAALAKMIAEDSNTNLLRDALTQVVGGSWQITVEAGTGASASVAQASDARPAAAPEPDPRDDSDENNDGSDDRDDDNRAAVRPVAPDPEAEALKLLSDQLGARPIGP